MHMCLLHPTPEILARSAPAQYRRRMTDGIPSGPEPRSAESGELVIGFVAPVGTDFDRLIRITQQCLVEFDYDTKVYRLSDFFKDLGFAPHAVEPESPNKTAAYRQRKAAMDAGDAMREQTKTCEIMAFYAAAKINSLRAIDEQDTSRRAPMARTAHLLRSLKRPEEVECLRRIYRSRFLLISAFVPREERLRHLNNSGLAESEAVELIVRDEVDAGNKKYGQATTETFQLADLFLDGRPQPEEEVRKELRRFFDLVFGSPRITPTQDEHAMFMAFAASLRSGDLSRQVGAVVVTEDGTVLSEGANDAPKFEGGQYWPGPDDRRDIVQENDSNERIKRRMATAILEEFGALEPDVDPLETAKRRLGKTGLLDITEFGRAVHAEMAALLNCARMGVATRGRVLYCTTFPCHNCAKHIIAAGILRVIFIEPYPKSRALELHEDALALAPTPGKVALLPFVGVGPRRYVDLFALRDVLGSPMSRKDGRLSTWAAKAALPALREPLVTYLEQEAWAQTELGRLVSENLLEQTPPLG
jgi:deoxycytidylate deaminase